MTIFSSKFWLNALESTLVAGLTAFSGALAVYGGPLAASLSSSSLRSPGLAAGAAGVLGSSPKRRIAANHAAADLVASRNDKVEESEYQWAQQKARNAELEGERAQLQSDLAALEALAARLKGLAVREKVAKKLTFDRAEQRRFDALPQAPA